MAYLGWIRKAEYRLKGKLTLHQREAPTILRSEHKRGDNQLLLVFTPTSGTSTPTQFTKNTTRSAMNETSEQLPLSPLTTFYAEASLASPFRWLVNGVVSLTPAVRSFLKSCGLLNKAGHRIYFSKTSKAYSTTTKDARLQPCSIRWMSWGTMSSGKCLTANIGYHKTGSGSLLSDILEDSPDRKYFLSQKAVDYIIKKSALDKGKRSTAMLYEPPPTKDKKSPGKPTS